jgi:predicted O-methyltransferase YrrM
MIVVAHDRGVAMSQEVWTSVDRYIAEQFIPEDAALEEALRESARAGLPSIAVSAAQGKWLHLLARAIGARRILEIGTLGGYSGIWLARALPTGGRLTTLELDAAHAEVARRNFVRAGLGDAIEIRLGPALQTLPTLRGPFDLIFIDADKPGYTEYFGWAVQLARPGSLIIADNVVRNGAVVDSRSADVAVRGIQRFNAAVAAEPRVTATVLQTVGVKGYDGFAVMLVEAA